jgi:hypothetical protein
VILLWNTYSWKNPVAQTAAELCSQQLEYFVPHIYVFQLVSVITETCSFAMEVRNLYDGYYPDFILSNQDTGYYSNSWSPFDDLSCNFTRSPWIYHPPRLSLFPDAGTLLNHVNTCILFKHPPIPSVINVHWTAVVCESHTCVCVRPFKLHVTCIFV